MHEVILKHREQVLEEGEHLDVLKYAMDQVHERHLPTMTFYQFCTFCQLRFRAKLEPT